MTANRQLMGNEMDVFQLAIEMLQQRGHSVERLDFPPPPLPGLYLVNGHELTERQVIDYARRVSGE
jgi:hypothetical protein